jgi:beta-glucosidase
MEEQIRYGTISLLRMRFLTTLLRKLHPVYRTPTHLTHPRNGTGGRELLRQSPMPHLSDLPPVPPGFLWGTATAGVQIEGELPAADWDLYVASPQIRRRLRTISRLFGVDLDPQPFGPAVRHFNTGQGGRLRFVEEDLDRARALGLNAYRFSVEWSRVQPSGSGGFDQDALTYYQDVARAALARGMTPVVTLNHLSLPLWVLTPPRVGLLRLLLNPEYDPAYRRHRGWLDETTIDHFLGFVRVVVPALMEVGVRIFITFNEPVGTLLGVGYIAGIFPPGLLVAGKAAQRAYWHIIAAHCQAYDFIKTLPEGSETQVGIAPAILHVVPSEEADGRVARRNRRAAHQFNYFFNLHMLDTLVFGQQNRSLDYRHAPRRDALQCVSTNGGNAPLKLDFIGINYYRQVHVSHSLIVSIASRFVGGTLDQGVGKSRVPHGLLSEEGYEIFPAGLYSQLRRLHRRYKAAFGADGRPLRFCITENGIGEAADANRAPYLVAHIEQILAAIRDGVDVFGYLYWSLMDNWEWVSNYRPASRHGLFSVDRLTPELPRCMTDAGMALGHMVSEGGLGQARERFGAFSADGALIEGPRLSAGRLYAGQLTTGKRRQDIELYLSARADKSLIGLIYYSYFRAVRGVAADLWVPLVDLQVDHGRLTFSHGPVRGRVGAAAYTVAMGTDPLFITGQGKVDGTDWHLEATLQPLGSYTVPAAAATKSDPRLWDGTWGANGNAWAPLIMTRYQHNSGLSNARQLLSTWVQRDCPPAGGIVSSGGQITLALLPSVPNPSGPLPDPITRQLFFTGSSLVNAAGETIFERAPDDV